MKIKIVVPLLIGLMMLTTSAISAACAESKKPEAIHFVYIHGTNYNTEKWRNIFYRDVDTLHQLLKSQFEKSLLIQETFLKNGQHTIAEKPVAYYWGDQTHEEIQFLNHHLDLTNHGLNRISINQNARKLIAHVLHDAAWFEKEVNKQEVLTKLFNTIHRKTSKGENVVVLGHSAGSLVTYELMTHRLAFFDVQSFLKEVGFIGGNRSIPQIENTCLKALLVANIVDIDDEGRFAPSETLKSELNQRLTNLQTVTQDQCIPANQLKGFVTFGSPLPVFSSSIGDFEKTDSYFSDYLHAFIYEHDIFWMHVNHGDDPIAVAIPEAELQDFLTGVFKTRHKGFIANHIGKHRGANVVNSHVWYWHKPKSFAKLMVKAYEEGYQRWNGERNKD